MATSSGWAQLGNTIAGGNKLNGELAYDQGQALGARTADALQQARERINKNNALENLDAKLAPYITDPKERAGAVAAAQAGIPLEQLSGFRGQNFTYNQRQVAADPNATDDARAQALFSIGNNDQVVRPVGEFQSTNVLHPSAGVAATALGSQLAGAKLDQQAATTDAARASAGLHREQTAHPEKFRTGLAPPPAPGAAPDGSTPLPNDATLLSIARNNQQAPLPGSLNYNRLGGEQAQRRIEWFAAHPDATVAGGTAPSFNGATFAVNRTTANDFARSTGTGGKLDSVNRIAGHLGVLEDLYSNLNNTNFTPTNQLMNAFRQLTGKQYPGSAKLAAQVIGTEAVKSMTNIGAGGQEERLNLASAFGPNGTPEGQQTALQTISRLVGEQAKDLAMRGSRGGLKGIYEPGKYFTPEAIRRYGLTDPTAAPPVSAPTPGVGAPPVAAGGTVKLPPQALAALKEGSVTTFGNGQKWTLKGGQPVQVP